MQNIIGLINFHNSPDVLPITESRPLGSTSFLGRYAFCDFALSSLCNSGISTVGLLVKDHQRSILKHLGSMDAWQSNTKISKTVVMFNEEAIRKPALNTDLQNIRQNDWILYDSNASHIVIIPSHIVASLDLREAIAEHIARDESITVVTTKVDDASEDYLGQMIIETDGEGYITGYHLNNGKQKGPALCSMSALIIKRTALATLCSVELELEPKKMLRDLVFPHSKRTGTRIHTYEFKGYSWCINSFKKYVQASFALLEPDNIEKLFRWDYQIYTLTHDTPPAIYGADAKVTGSFVSNGAQIEGTVEHSIIARDVKIAKGAVVRNSIIFSSTRIDEGAIVENAVVDKYVIVTKRHEVRGLVDSYAYVKQGAIV